MKGLLRHKNSEVSHEDIIQKKCNDTHLLFISWNPMLVFLYTLNRICF